MKLKNLLNGVDVLKLINFKNVKINSITINHKECLHGSLYFCIAGNSFDGTMFCADAVRFGCVAIVTATELNIDNVIQIIVKDVRVSMAIIAKNYYNHSDEKLSIISVIGTNGKTTTATLIYKFLLNANKKVGLIGTNGLLINDMCLPGDLTTPDPIELHYIFSQMVFFGVEYVVMEVSAHAIFYNKMYGVKNKIGVFTNITPEHLDFFGTMENYAKVKLNYFTNQFMESAVINVDDPYGKQLFQNIKLPCATYGLYNPANSFAIDIKTSLKGSSFFANIKDDVFKIKCGLVGDYNVYNLLASITVARMLGCSVISIVKTAKSLKSIAGRFQVFSKANNKIIVDFAHTPDGFEQVLSLARRLTKGKLITLFGCVGYSTPQKRHDMGSIAQKYSDYVILSSDNPNFTSFDDIAKDVDLHKDYSIIAERKKAVEFGIDMLTNNDFLMVLGKGSETKQKVNGQNINYSDIETIENYLRKRK